MILAHMDDRLALGLEENGVVYAVRASSRGVPYAGFRWSDSPDSFESAVTAILEEENLRLTFHKLVAPGDLKAVALLNRSLPLGGVYRAPETDEVELSLAIHVAGASDITGLMRALLAYGQAVCRWLAQRGEVPAPPALGVADCAAPGRMTANALREIGLNPTPAATGATASVTGPPRFSVRLSYESPTACFHAEGRYDPPALLGWGPNELALFHRLQRWTVGGRYVLERDGEIRADVWTPHLGEAAPAAEWTAAQAIVMMQTAAKHLGISR